MLVTFNIRSEENAQERGERKPDQCVNKNPVLILTLLLRSYGESFAFHYISIYSIRIAFDLNTTMLCLMCITHQFNFLLIIPTYLPCRTATSSTALAIQKQIEHLKPIGRKLREDTDEVRAKKCVISYGFVNVL